MLHHRNVSVLRGVCVKASVPTGMLCAYRLVAPMTMTEPRSCKPSMRHSTVDTTLANTWSVPPVRSGTSASSSSRKMMEGAFFSAWHQRR